MNLDLPTFKQHLRDFLIQIKEFASEDNKDMFSEETQRQQQEQASLEQARRQAVPGIMNPYEAPGMGDL